MSPTARLPVTYFAVMTLADGTQLFAVYLRFDVEHSVVVETRVVKPSSPNSHARARSRTSSPTSGRALHKRAVSTSPARDTNSLGSALCGRPGNMQRSLRPPPPSSPPPPELLENMRARNIAEQQVLGKKPNNSSTVKGKPKHRTVRSPAPRWYRHGCSRQGKCSLCIFSHISQCHTRSRFSRRGACVSFLIIPRYARLVGCTS